MPLDSSSWVALAEIIWINALLSGDNAVVIAMACRSLPSGSRRAGMVLGAGAAILLRLAFTILIVRLLGVPYLKIVGGLALTWIAIDLIRPKAEAGPGVGAPDSLLRAVGTIAVADVVMSLDNVIAIAGVAGDHFWLLIVGLVISIPIIVAGSAVIMAVMDRLPVVVWAGAALLGYVAGDMILTDRALSDRLGEAVASRWDVWVAVAFAAFVVAVGWLWTRAAAVGRANADRARR